MPWKGLPHLSSSHCILGLLTGSLSTVRYHQMLARYAAQQILEARCSQLRDEQWGWRVRAFFVSDEMPCFPRLPRRMFTGSRYGRPHSWRMLGWLPREQMLRTTAHTAGRNMAHAARKRGRGLGACVCVCERQRQSVWETVWDESFKRTKRLWNSKWGSMKLCCQMIRTGELV